MDGARARLAGRRRHDLTQLVERTLVSGMIPIVTDNADRLRKQREVLLVVGARPFSYKHVGRRQAGSGANRGGRHQSAVPGTHRLNRCWVSVTKESWGREPADRGFLMSLLQSALSPQISGRLPTVDPRSQAMGRAMVQP